MSNNSKDASEFYIGWQTHAPAPFANAARRFALVLVVLIPLATAVLVFTQRGFVPSVFEFGNLSEVEGILVLKPIPMLKVPQGFDGQGNTVFKSILLVGFGKKGAAEDLAKVATREGKALHHESVVLRGTLIYYNGKTLLELSEGTAAFVAWGQASNRGTFRQQDLGSAKLRGEILDPKCAFGVMKPGEGKPHRSCAVRCISGGIPPVLRVRNEAGQANYLLLLDEKGQPLNSKVLNYVGDQVQVCGTLKQEDDWLVLHTRPEKDILRLKAHWMEGEIGMCSK